MKVALIQMAMSADIEENLTKTLGNMKQAADLGADLVCFPEIQFSPFFPQFKAKDATKYAMAIDHESVIQLRHQAKSLGLVCIPNLYLKEQDKMYDASPLIENDGEILGISKMVHIVQIPYFYEQDYYIPSDNGFQVYQTSVGKIGVVICFDRHFPESIRTCVLKGAEVIVVPTAIVSNEPLEMFEWEMRVAAMQNNVFIAMCNRVGLEDELDFAGRSMIIDPNGEVLAIAGNQEQSIIAELDFNQIIASRNTRPFLSLRRPDNYLWGN